MQQTLKNTITFKGVGLHTGADVTLTLKPAPANHGITFLRTDLIPDLGRENASLPACYDMVEHSELCTRLINDHGASVSTIEHLMSALAGFGVDNVLAEIDGPEMPILDGSSLQYAAEISRTGTVMQDKPRKALRILESIEIEENGKKAAFIPSHIPVYTFSIDFPNTAIGRQDLTFEFLGAETYAENIASCRTFAKLEEVEFLRSKGLIKGGSLENALVVDKEKVVNGPLRCNDEFVRHKILDAIGDVALCGSMMIGHFISSKGGHMLTNKLLRKLFDTPSAYRIEEAYSNMETLPREAAPAEPFVLDKISA
jgi:UDP-3-O-[3-hydroxymyristoyl] N-acetylglucosamine deacetylase